MAPFTYISAEEVLALLDRFQIFDSLERAFGEFSKVNDSTIKQPVRSMIQLEEHSGFFGVMPAYSGADGALACKLVCAYPNNAQFNLPTHLANIMLFDPVNGSLLAVMDGEVITAERTALASAVATKYLSKSGSRTLALLGSGTQAKSHLQALSMIHTFETVRVWSRTYSNAVRFATENGCTACENVEDAVKDADVICTLTFSKTPVLKAEWVKPGAHINAVGAVSPTWQELDTPLMKESVLYADSREACNKESGDVIISGADIYAEIGEVINGTKDAHPDKTTIFKSVGIAIEDVVSAKCVYDKYIAKQSLQS